MTYLIRLSSGKDRSYQIPQEKEILPEKEGNKWLLFPAGIKKIQDDFDQLNHCPEGGRYIWMGAS